MNFNPVLTMQAQKVVFSWKINKSFHPNLTFKNCYVLSYISETSELSLDIKLKFIEHLKGILDLN